MFQTIFRHVARLQKDDRGQDLIEYGLLVSIITVAMVLVMPSIGAKLDAAFEQWGNQVYDAWEPEDPDWFVPPSP